MTAQNLITPPDPKLLARYIDHTLLKSDTLPSEILQICREAELYGFASVCIQPCWLEMAVARLSNSKVLTATVIGFPMGVNTPLTKQREAEEAASLGADELDMVINVGLLKAGEYSKVQKDISGVVNAAPGMTVKVIIETCLLTDSEKTTACRLAVDAGAAFVKTSTGMAGGGSTVQDIRLMRSVVGQDFGVKASGGIRSREDALSMIEAGASRIGTSAGVKIISGIN